MSNKDNRNEKSYYRESLGSKLKYYRLKKHLSIDDIVYMTQISRSSILKIESGKAKDIDSYVEYGKAVQYPLETLTDFGITLKPFKELTKERKDRINLTYKIREHIVNSNFLTVGKTVGEIKEELLRLKLVPKNITSVAIAGVMRNLLKDEIINARSEGRKNLYLKK